MSVPTVMMMVRSTYYKIVVFFIVDLLFDSLQEESALNHNTVRSYSIGSYFNNYARQPEPFHLEHTRMSTEIDE